MCVPIRGMEDTNVIVTERGHGKEISALSDIIIEMKKINHTMERTRRLSSD